MQPERWPSPPRPSGVRDLVAGQCPGWRMHPGGPLCFLALFIFAALLVGAACFAEAQSPRHPSGDGDWLSSATHHVEGTLVGADGWVQTAGLEREDQFDPNLGSRRLRAHYLNPTTGRFWSMDSFEGNASESLSLHKFLYAHGNPVMNTDPSGNETLIGLNINIGIRVGLAGAGIGAYKAQRTGQNVFYGAATGFAFGFVGGATLGAAPAAFFTTKAGVALLATFSGAALNSAINYANAGYYDLAAIDAAFALAPLAMRPATPGSVGSLEPPPQSLSNLDTRLYYNNEIQTLHMIVQEMRAGGKLTVETIAKFASDYRNVQKIRARALMEDQATAQNLPPIRPTEYYIQKAQAEGKTGDAVWEAVIKGALKPNPTVNAQFGIE